MQQPSRALALVWSSIALVALWLPWAIRITEVDDGHARQEVSYGWLDWPNQSGAWHLHRVGQTGSYSAVPLVLEILVIVATLVLAAGVAYWLANDGIDRADTVRTAALIAGWVCVVLGIVVRWRLHHGTHGDYDEGLMPQFGLWIWQIATLFSALALSVSPPSGLQIAPSLLERRP